MSKSRFICIAIIAVTTAFMAGSTWLTWPDPIYDFGTHLYFPWQIAAGRHLYTDIAYFNGPLSEYFNAAMFKLFGVSIHTLMLVNAGILLAVIAIIFQLLIRLSDLLTATIACMVFVIVFAFAGYSGVGIGNYNWICPYTHEVTHGVALSLAMLLALQTFFRTGKTRWLLLASLFLGLVFLTKAEVFAPAFAAFASGLMLRVGFVGSRRASKESLLSCLPFATVLLIAFAALALQTSPSVALRGVLGSWPWVFDQRIAKLQFYQQGLGSDDLPANLWRMLLIGIESLLLVAGAVATGIVPKRWRITAILLFIAELMALLFYWQRSMQVARPWPGFLAVIASISIWQSWRADSANRSKPALRAIFAIFALGLLGKMLFNARPWQYGFALAMPAAMVLIEALIGWLPSWLATKGYDGKTLRQSGIALVGVLSLCLYANQRPSASWSVPVSTGSDAFMADARGEEVNLACKEINSLIPTTGTLAVMPQGLMLNVLTRRANPIPVVNIMPPEVMSVGEDAVVTQLNAHPPDLIVLSEKDIADGALILTEGRYHYGQKIYAWVLAHYQCRVPADAGTQLRLSIWIIKNR